MRRGIRKIIIERQILPGAPIRQDELATRFGVSRVPVREALMTLEAEGIVTYAPHLGFTVPELTADDLIEAYTIRRALEDLAIPKTIERATTEDLRIINALLADADAALKQDDLSILIEANRMFHFGLLEVSRMPRLIRMVRRLYDSLAPYRPVRFMTEQERQRLQDEHHSIVEAIRERDVDRAIASLTDHRKTVVKALIDAVATGAHDGQHATS